MYTTSPPQADSTQSQPAPVLERLINETDHHYLTRIDKKVAGHNRNITKLQRAIREQAGSHILPQLEAQVKRDALAMDALAALRLTVTGA